MLPENKYFITEFYGIQKDFLTLENGEIDRARFEEIAESGLNLVTLEGTPEMNKKALKVCEELGLMCTVIDPRMNEAMKLEDGWEKLIADIVADYKDSPALFNYHVMDEPNGKNFPMLRAISDKLLELDPAHEPYINLFPNYASPEQLGAPTYYDHIEQFVNEVKPTLISYDHYHFCKGVEIEQHEFATERDRLIYENAFLATNRAGFFDNIEIVRDASLRYNIPFMVIVLLVEHGSYRYLSEAELRWEVFQSLAYGSALLSYFTYWTPYSADDDVWHWKEGMISADGKKLQHYYDVQKINKDLSLLGNALVGKRSEAVFHIGEEAENVKFFEGYGEIESIDVPTATVGFFEGGYALIANKDFKASAEVKVVSGAKLEMLDKASGEWVALEGGSFTLGAGDGELIRVAK